MTNALKAVQEGKPLKSAAKQYNIPARTQRRHRDGKLIESGTIHLGHFTADITEECEQELVETIQRMEKARSD